MRPRGCATFQRPSVAPPVPLPCPSRAPPVPLPLTSNLSTCRRQDRAQKQRLYACGREVVVEGEGNRHRRATIQVRPYLATQNSLSSHI